MTDENGKGEIYISKLGEDIYAYKQGYALQKIRVRKADKDKKVAIVFKLVPEEAVTGKVVDSQGQVVAGAKLIPSDLLRSIKPKFETLTNEQGEFTLEALPNKETLSYYINKKGFSYKYCNLSTLTARKPIVITRKLHLTGTVTDIDTGKTLQGMQFSVIEEGTEYSDPTEYKDLGDGKFSTYFYYNHGLSPRLPSLEKMHHPGSENI